MSVLLRHPASVPALFSRADEPDAPPERAPRSWRPFARAVSLGLAAGVVLADVPLGKAAAAAVGFALAR